MTGQLDCSEILDLDTGDAARIHTAARALAAEPGDDAAETERAFALTTAFPAEFSRALHRFRSGGSAHNALLVDGLVPPLPALPATPGTTTPPALGPAADAAALTLLGVISQLGEPFTFASLYEGRLVQHVTPVPGQEDAQTSEGSDTVLEWHVEDAFTEDRCDFFGLLCLRGDPGAATLLAAARGLDLPPEVDQVLRQPRFVVAPDIAHGAEPDLDVPPSAVLTGPPVDPEICFDAVYQRPADPGDAEAVTALKVLAAAINAAAIGHVLQPGQLLIADNRRVVHGRTVFRPRYDGTDRWLLRTMVCASARAHRRRGTVRALR